MDLFPTGNPFHEFVELKEVPTNPAYGRTADKQALVGDGKAGMKVALMKGASGMEPALLVELRAVQFLQNIGTGIHHFAVLFSIKGR